MTRARLKELNFLGWLFATAVLLVAVHESEDHVKPRDFVYVYSVGTILNQYTPDHLYQDSYQQQTFNRIVPIKDGRYGPSPYPPFVAVFFRLFALMPFWTAYRLWMLTSMVSYLAGIALLVRKAFPDDKLRQSLFCCFSLLYWPFVARTLLNGQLSAIGFLAIAGAICLEDSDHPYLSGGVLAICSYKPTLLFLIFPMLLITRRYKSVLGFTVGAGLLTILTTAVAGTGIWPAYFRMSAEYARMRDIVLPEYVDLRAFSTAISGGKPAVVWALLSLGCVAGAALARIWFFDRSQASSLPSSLLWSTTITWTMILNVYVPLYDTILVVMAIILSAGALRALAPRASSAIMFGILITSYFTRAIAETTGIQVLTIFLVALGVLQIWLCFRLMRAQVVAESGDQRTLPVLLNICRRPYA
jgi:hypothetical protein